MGKKPWRIRILSFIAVGFLIGILLGLFHKGASGPLAPAALGRLKEAGLDPAACLYEIVKSMKENADGRIVTIKIRKGVLGMNNAVEVALAAQEGGADMVTVHGRTREEMYSGTADYEAIAKVKNALRIPVCGNGDVVDKTSYERMKQTGVDYVMVARGAMGRPYVFAEIRGENPSYVVADLIKEHIKYLDFIPEKIVAANMKKQIGYYLKGLPGKKKVKENIFRSESLAEMLGLIDQMD